MKTLSCSRCILDSHIPNISFDNMGVCNYCKIHEKWEKEYLPQNYNNIIKQIMRDGKHKKYDCVVGVSGGCDSSFLLCLLKDAGLRPLAVHWNNGWNTEIAERNIQRIVKTLNVDYIEIGMDKREYDDICRSFLLASVPDADIPNDIALTTVLYYVAERFGTKYLMNAHSFRTEGTTPLGWSYMDGKYIDSVQRKFGSVSLQTFPNLWLRQWFKWMLLHRIKRIRLLWYANYNKEKVKKDLEERFGWQWYGGHHMENKYTIFVGNYLQPKKFGIDLRWIEYSALIRSGQMSREEAIERIKTPLTIDPAILEEVKTRLNIKSFEEILNTPKKTHDDYETCHQTFRRLRPFFWLMNKFRLVPATFYVKYCCN